jgi:hypothetical protein
MPPSFAVLWYAVHELSPLKPFPGLARLMLPRAPLAVAYSAIPSRGFAVDVGAAGQSLGLSLRRGERGGGTRGGQGDGKENFGHNDYPHRLKFVPHLSRRRPKYSTMPVNRI